MDITNKFIDQSRLRAGDIILCHGKNGKDIIADKIEKATNSRYIHAAICINETMAVESGLGSVLVSYGAKINQISSILERYPHVAIFRQPDAWKSERSINALNEFVNSRILANTNYNFSGVKNFEKNKIKHEITLHKQLDSYFDGKLKPKDFRKDTYFCSELVVSCFVATGFLDESAAVLYQGNTFSPFDLGNDPTFGTFLGYISTTEHYSISETDPFYYRTTYDEIFY